MVYKVEAIPVTYFFNKQSDTSRGSMLLRVCLLLALAAVINTAPSKQKLDLSASEGRHLPAYAPAHPSPYAPAKHSSATVSSYNRRGPQVTQYAKPSTIYGSSYAPQPSVRSPVYSPEPQAHGYASQSLGYPGPAPGYGGYGPQSNAYSEQSRHLSHDPNYDAAKDPVSQYADYVPAREYGSKGHSNGNELSIYGYRK